MHPAARFTPILVACLVSGATLERLSLEDMIQKSTTVVRGRVTAVSAQLRDSAGRRSSIYTHYTIQVSEHWKGSAASKIDVAVPGGTVQTRRQSFPGAPTLKLNTDYVLFLWTGPSGLTQIIGLSQGLIKVTVDAGGNAVLSRSASQEPMVDASGNAVADRAFSMSIGDFRATMSKYGMATGK